jgi:transposase
MKPKYNRDDRTKYEPGERAARREAERAKALKLVHQGIEIPLVATRMGISPDKVRKLVREAQAMEQTP